MLSSVLANFRMFKINKGNERKKSKMLFYRLSVLDGTQAYRVGA
jgi:hypothetical protein